MFQGGRSYCTYFDDILTSTRLNSKIIYYFMIGCTLFTKQSRIKITVTILTQI